MSNEKQIIEEMARKMCRNYQPNGNCASDGDPCELECIYGYCAERIYCADYRKVEWISVEERKPSESGKYLVCTLKGNVYQTKFYTYPENKGGHWGQKDKGRSITHWMPLPEAPKGGE